MAEGETQGPNVTVTYCRLCGWLLRASWTAQELLTTFAEELGSVTLIPDDTGGVLPGPSGELPAHSVEMNGAEIGERCCGLPGRDRQLARVEGITPAGGQDRDRHPSTHPRLRPADPSAQLRRGQATLERHQPFDRCDLFRQREVAAVRVLRQSGLDHLHPCHRPHHGRRAHHRQARRRAAQDDGHRLSGPARCTGLV